MHRPATVSVIIPALNAAAYIRQAIESALAQTHPVHEIVVVDGGSRDGTEEIARGYGPRVRVIEQRPSGRKGIGAARNLGIEASSGEWVAFLDADDWWDPQITAMRLTALESNPEARLSYTGRYTVYEATGERLLEPAREGRQIWPSLRWINQVSNSSVLAHRRTVVEAGGFREDIRCFEDWEMWVRLRRLCPFASVAEPLLFYRVLPGSSSHDFEVHVDGIPIVLEALLAGTTGWRRHLYERYIWAAQLRGAALIARENGSSKQLGLALRSILKWPMPTFLGDRYRIAAHMLLARTAG
jgi:glycosyltransferase involved in cell wall biosynthesis